MFEKTIVINNDAGLDGRQASQFVQLASKFRSTIRIYKEGRDANAKSVISVLSMAISKGQAITIKADGPDGKEAVEALAAIVERFSK